MSILSDLWMKLIIWNICTINTTCNTKGKLDRLKYTPRERDEHIKIYKNIGIFSDRDI